MKLINVLILESEMNPYIKQIQNAKKSLCDLLHTENSISYRKLDSKFGFFACSDYKAKNLPLNSHFKFKPSVFGKAIVLGHKNYSFSETFNCSLKGLSYKQIKELMYKYQTNISCDYCNRKLIPDIFSCSSLTSFKYNCFCLCGVHIELDIFGNKGYESSILFELCFIDNQLALFTDSPRLYARNLKKNLPNNLYIYDIRHDDSGTPVSLEPTVFVDYFGSIILKNPIDFNGKSYINLEELGLNYLGSEVSITNFLNGNFENPLNM